MTIQLAFLLSIFYSTSFAQCTIQEFFPVEHGTSKFNTIIALKQHKNIVEYYDRNNLAISYKSTPEYLNGDTIRRSSYSFKYKWQDCILGYDNEIDLDFADDKLFKMNMDIFFYPEDLDKCINNYNRITETLLKTEKYHAQYINRDSDTNEQTGEGYSFNPYHEFRPKIEQINVEYRIIYEKNYNSYLQETIKTGKIKHYILTIQSVNLNATKLDNRGY